MPRGGALGGKRCLGQLKGVGVGLVLLCAIPGIAQVAAAEGPTATCNKFAAVSGSDTGAGTLADPYATPLKLVGSLTAGQTGCFRAGTYVFS